MEEPFQPYTVSSSVVCIPKEVRTDLWLSNVGSFAIWSFAIALIEQNSVSDRQVDRQKTY